MPDQSSLTNTKSSLTKVNRYSNYRKAQIQTRKVLGPKAKLYLSDRKNKKFMVIDPHTNKKINFGQIGYEDWLKHHDPERRRRFLTRNRRWKQAPKYSAAYLAYHILW